jgi:outer membrane protein TolC
MRSILAAAFLSALVPGAGGSAAQDAAKPMTLEACLVRAMEKNLGLQVQIRNPELANLAVSRAGEKYLPTLSFQYNQETDRNASESWISSSSGQIQTKSNSYYAQLAQILPTGGTIQATLSSGMTDTNQRFQTINPYYSSTLSFSFNQPLLRDFGPAISRREILVARINRDIADQTLKRGLLQTLYNTEEAYWNLYYAIENLKVMRQSLRLAEDLLARNKKELAIGMMPPIEVTTAESEVATRKADILEAEVLVKNREDALRTLLDFEGKSEADAASIVPADVPSIAKQDLNMDAALGLASANRPEMESARLDLKNRDLDLVYARNQLLPTLSLVANYWSPGVSGTQILYQNDNPLTGIIIGTIPSGSSQATKDALQFKYKNWSVGLNLSIPLNTVFSRAMASQATVSLEQSRLSARDTEQQIFLEVRSAVRDVENNIQRIDAYGAARRLAEKKLEAEERKAKAGLSTNYNVLLVQRDLALAQTRELQARIDGVLSQARLDKATGTSAERHNIKWSGATDKRP